MSYHYITTLNVVTAEKVRVHLQKYVLVSKEPELLMNVRVLGLRVSCDDKGYYWERDGLVDEVAESLTKRELFSLRGKLVGHYPVVGCDPHAVL